MAELNKGEGAPEFTLADQAGSSCSLSSLKGKKVLLYFYPKADTPGCTAQACSVRDNLISLRKHGVEPLGVSPDGPAAQKRFDDKYSLGFRLLSDTDHAVATAYGVWNEARKGIDRSSFLIDEAGKIEAAWYGVKPAETVSNVLAALKR